MKHRLRNLRVQNTIRCHDIIYLQFCFHQHNSIFFLFHKYSLCYLKFFLGIKVTCVCLISSVNFYSVWTWGYLCVMNAKCIVFPSLISDAQKFWGRTQTCCKHIQLTAFVSFVRQHQFALQKITHQVITTLWFVSLGWHCIYIGSQAIFVRFYVILIMRHHANVTFMHRSKNPDASF